MTVANGDDANQTEFNTSFMSREEDTSTVGKVGLLEPGSTSMNDAQQLLNALRTWVGKITVAANEGDKPVWASYDPNANVVGLSTDDMIDKIVAIVLLFVGATGHTHNGSNGNGPKIDLVTAINGILNPLNGGTGLNASSAANGEIIIGNGAGFTLAVIEGTSNQVIVTNGAGSITLSLPQDIHSTAIPTFEQIILQTDPDAPLKVATKQYVDNLVQGLKWKQNVRAATTAAGTIATDFEEGDFIDGVELAAGDRILLKNQADASENGIYEVQLTGACTRALDANAFEELNSAAVFVSEGTTNADKGFQQTAELTALSDPQTWVQSFGTGLYTVNGQALQELSARVFSLVIDGSTLSQSASGLKVADGIFVTLSGNETISGDKTFTGLFKASGDLALDASQDSATTGASALVPDAGTPIIELTNASLTSVASLFASAPTQDLLILLVNRTGATITFEHNNGSPASSGFALPGSGSLELQNNLTLFVYYSLAAARWIVVGGSGAAGGGGGLMSRNTFTGTSIAATAEARQAWVYTSGTEQTLASINPASLDDQAEIEITVDPSAGIFNVNNNDVSEGWILNGDYAMGPYSKLLLRWDATFDRYVEAYRNGL